METRNRVPENWFIDPVLLGITGAYSDPENDPLAWQGDALCAQTDPEAFFKPKAVPQDELAFLHEAEGKPAADEDEEEPAVRPNLS